MSAGTCSTPEPSWASFSPGTGADWIPFQLNLPITPITDLRVHRGNLIASTSGRSIWVLDDLVLIRQHRADAADLALFTPADAYLVNGGELNGSDASFTGAVPGRGVNPSTGMVLYYRLPKVESKDSLTLTLEVRDAAGALVRRFSSKKDTAFHGGTAVLRLTQCSPSVSASTGSSGTFGIRSWPECRACISRPATGATRPHRGAIASRSSWASGP